MTILEVAGTTATEKDIWQMEGLWQSKLQSIQMGLNKNSAGGSMAAPSYPDEQQENIESEDRNDSNWEVSESEAMTLSMARAAYPGKRLCYVKNENGEKEIMEVGSLS